MADAETIEHRAERLRLAFGNTLADLPNAEARLAHLQQLMVELMDWTEQTDEEHHYIALDVAIAKMRT